VSSSYLYKQNKNYFIPKIKHNLKTWKYFQYRPPFYTFKELSSFFKTKYKLTKLYKKKKFKRS
jgi:hypothetical protein